MRTPALLCSAGQRRAPARARSRPRFGGGPEGVVPRPRPSQTGSTALHAAAGKGHVAAVEALLDARADREACREDGWRPLHTAAWGGHSSAVRALLAAGADKEAAGAVRARAAVAAAV